MFSDACDFWALEYQKERPTTSRSIKPLSRQFAPLVMLKPILFPFMCNEYLDTQPLFPHLNAYHSGLYDVWIIVSHPGLFKNTADLSIVSDNSRQHKSPPCALPQREQLKLWDSTVPCSHPNVAGQCTAPQVTALVKLELQLCQPAKPPKFPGKWAAGCAPGKASNPSRLLLHLLPGLLSKDRHNRNLPSG